MPRVREYRADKDLTYLNSATPSCGERDLQYSPNLSTT